MNEQELIRLLNRRNVSARRIRLARWIESKPVQNIVIATFTILNLFIGIIVSTMQELSTLPDVTVPDADLKRTLSRMEQDLATLRAALDQRTEPE